jgi:hypothetical protein
MNRPNKSSGPARPWRCHPGEAQELLDYAIEGIAQAGTAALEIRSRIGGEGNACVITLGEQGMVLVDPGGDV